MYVKIFLVEVLDCCGSVAKDMLVDVCIHGIVEDYIIYIENLSFSSFFRLRELRGARMNLSERL